MHLYKFKKLLLPAPLNSNLHTHKLFQNWLCKFYFKRGCSMEGYRLLLAEGDGGGSGL